MDAVGLLGGRRDELKVENYVHAEKQAGETFLPLLNTDYKICIYRSKLNNDSHSSIT